ncbi:Acyl-coenzyme A thioesterase PaaI, contains HGG motif [Halobacillus alkaliphilus]|uniref:Acyl-coenzyme A thioesterase PaaI, contains HGG motif n=1 Tax=Halobacillus alkaliphilus TaxID=396056 RepID=A0A1I2LJ06_9BACI|nr:PaaI family thioesterase [Halobacillus alkaliphilus]SFF78548.1 Acyl-coenzyme A thioesterase PaaI, contains HGG motif [Halobacillus alkaliphilus]
MRGQSSFFEHIGCTKHRGREGEILLTLQVQPEILTVEGTIPPGIFSSMLDIVIGSTIAELVQQPTTTVNLNINYFDFTNCGPFTAVGTIIWRNEKLIAGEGSVLDRDGNLTAKAAGTFKVMGRSIE